LAVWSKLFRRNYRYQRQLLPTPNPSSSDLFHWCRV